MKCIVLHIVLSKVCLSYKIVYSRSSARRLGEQCSTGIQPHIENGTFLVALRVDCHHHRPLPRAVYVHMLLTYVKKAIPTRVGGCVEDKNNYSRPPPRDKCHGATVARDCDKMLETPGKRNINANSQRLSHWPAIGTQSATPGSRSNKRARHKILQRANAKQLEAIHDVEFDR